MPEAFVDFLESALGEISSEIDVAPLHTVRFAAGSYTYYPLLQICQAVSGEKYLYLQNLY